jgi:hypothetical protein
MAPKRTMTADHKAALAKGREAGRAVRAYLEALEANRPRRGRKVTLESLQERLNVTNERVNAEEDPLPRLLLVQQALDLEAEIHRRGGEAGVDLAAAEQQFVKYAKSYSESKGISYTAWREIGVAPSVLEAAGISRQRS